MAKPLFIARQARRPTGFFGRIVARVMARETACDNAEAIELLETRPRDRVLDIGTGHGASLQSLAKLVAQGHVTGLDFSDVMLAVARTRNRLLIKQGRIELVRAKADALPFENSSFERAMATHVIYFWDPAEPYLRDIARVLVPDGLFVVGFRPGEDEALANRMPAPVYKRRTTQEVERLLETCGFCVERVKRRDKPGKSMVWLVARRKAELGV